MAGRGESCISVMAAGMTTEQRLDHIERKLGIKSVGLRPEIGRCFWMRNWTCPWRLWKSTKIGIVRIDDEGNTISHPWEEFDRNRKSVAWIMGPEMLL